MLAYLLTLVEEKDEEFFVSIYQEYKSVMHIVANRVLKDELSAEDAVHNAFINVAKHITTLRALEKKALKYYLLKTVRNSAIDIIKKTSKEISVENIYAETDEAIDKIDSFGDRSLIIAIINELPPIYKTAIYYYFVLGIPETEIARMLGMNVNTVRQQVLRGRRRFIEKYNKETETI